MTLSFPLTLNTAPSWCITYMHAEYLIYLSLDFDSFVFFFRKTPP